MQRWPGPGSGTSVPGIEEWVDVCGLRGGQRETAVCVEPRERCLSRLMGQTITFAQVLAAVGEVFPGFSAGRLRVCAKIENRDF